MHRLARPSNLAVCAALAFASVCCGAFLAEEPSATVVDLVRQGDAAYREGDWATCAEHYARAGSLAFADLRSSATYNAACCHALAGNVDLAFAELERSIEAGYHDLAHLQIDSDLALLHEDPRWEAAVAKVEAARQVYRDTINVELLELYEQDQADRSGTIDWSLVGPRDEARRKRVAEIVDAAGAATADDYFHAAMVFQHGSEPEEIKQAHEWAVRAVELDPDHDSARWLAAASEDRYLMYLEKPQKYGTQFRKVDDRWILWEVDPTVTDEERARWNVPTLAESRRRAEAMNRSA